MNKRLLIMALVLILVTCGGIALGSEETERTDGGFFALVNEKGEVIDRTALMVNIGDEYITPSNQRYKLVRLQGDTAYCRFMGMEKMPAISSREDSQAVTVSSAIPVAAKGKPMVAIYHTHSDESYVPSDGTESQRGGGGILDVGQVLEKELRSLGINAVHDTSIHDPHDINAYYRSRRTATRLLRQGPNMLVDVHRDSVPPEVYQTSVKGTKATKVKLVVGRQNTNKSSNLELAKRLKAHMDQATPGLSGGIFMGKGNYNQDLTPRSILVEVGADSNSKVDAEKGISMFAQSLASVLGADTAAARKPMAGEGGQRSTDWRTIIWIIVAGGVAYAAYVYLNRGKIK